MKINLCYWLRIIKVEYLKFQKSHVNFFVRFNPLSASVFLQKFPKKSAFRKIAISQNLHKLEEKYKHESRKKINVVFIYPVLFVKFCD